MGELDPSFSFLHRRSHLKSNTFLFLRRILSHCGDNSFDSRPSVVSDSQSSINDPKRLPVFSFHSCTNQSAQLSSNEFVDRGSTQLDNSFLAEKPNENPNLAESQNGMSQNVDVLVDSSLLGQTTQECLDGDKVESENLAVEIDTSISTQNEVSSDGVLDKFTQQEGRDEFVGGDNLKPGKLTTEATETGEVVRHKGHMPSMLSTQVDQPVGEDLLSSGTEHGCLVSEAIGMKEVGKEAQQDANHECESMKSLPLDDQNKNFELEQPLDGDKVESENLAAEKDTFMVGNCESVSTQNEVSSDGVLDKIAQLEGTDEFVSGDNLKPGTLSTEVMETDEVVHHDGCIILSTQVDQPVKEALQSSGAEDGCLGMKEVGKEAQQDANNECESMKSLPLDGQNENFDLEQTLEEEIQYHDIHQEVPHLKVTVSSDGKDNSVGLIGPGDIEEGEIPDDSAVPNQPLNSVLEEFVGVSEGRTLKGRISDGFIEEGGLAQMCKEHIRVDREEQVRVDREGTASGSHLAGGLSARGNCMGRKARERKSCDVENNSDVQCNSKPNEVKWSFGSSGFGSRENCIGGKTNEMDSIGENNESRFPSDSRIDEVKWGSGIGGFGSNGNRLGGKINMKNGTKEEKSKKLGSRKTNGVNQSFEVDCMELLGKMKFGSSKAQGDTQCQVAIPDGLGLPGEKSKKIQSPCQGTKSSKESTKVHNKRKRGSNKAKKKEAKKRKRAELNRAQGVKRLKLQPITKPKVVKDCQFYLKGRCQQGDKCKFSHDVVPLTKSKPCKHFPSGSCLKGEDCPFDHQLSKYPCINYNLKGNCSRGGTCLFSHEIKLNEGFCQEPKVRNMDSRPVSLLPLPQKTSTWRQLNQASIPPVSNMFKDPTLTTPGPLKEPVTPEGIQFLSFGKAPLDDTNKQQEHCNFSSDKQSRVERKHFPSSPPGALQTPAFVGKHGSDRTCQFFRTPFHASASNDSGICSFSSGLAKAQPISTPKALPLGPVSPGNLHESNVTSHSSFQSPLNACADNNPVSSSGLATTPTPSGGSQSRSMDASKILEEFLFSGML